MSPLTLSPPTESSVIASTLAQFIHKLETTEHLDPDRAATLLQDANIDPRELLPWYDFEHPVQGSYGRKLVKKGRNYELMVMSWAPSDYSAIHDHGIAEWGAVQYFGAADHIIFKEHHGVLTTETRMRMSLSSVYAVDHSLIHLMGNPGDTPFVSLHLYGRKNPAETITGNARIFDLWEQRIQRTDGGVFFGLPESEILWREIAPTADRETTLLHHQLMLNRVKNILLSEEFNPELSQRANQLRIAIEQLSRSVSEMSDRHEGRLV